MVVAKFLRHIPVGDGRRVLRGGVVMQPPPSRLSGATMAQTLLQQERATRKAYRKVIDQLNQGTWDWNLDGLYEEEKQLRGELIRILGEKAARKAGA